jgi:hypothetical protein
MNPKMKLHKSVGEKDQGIFTKEMWLLNPTALKEMKKSPFADRSE